MQTETKSHRIIPRHLRTNHQRQNLLDKTALDEIIQALEEQQAIIQDQRCIGLLTNSCNCTYDSVNNPNCPRYKPVNMHYYKVGEWWGMKKQEILNRAEKNQYGIWELYLTDEELELLKENV